MEGISIIPTPMCHVFKNTRFQIKPTLQNGKEQSNQRKMLDIWMSETIHKLLDDCKSI
jgi:hypothetical protein